METKLSSASREVIIGDGRPTMLIGERINPAGKKKMAEALRSGNLGLIFAEAVKQVKDGADIIDVNVTLHSLDEVSLLPRVVEMVMKVVDVPLCIDSSNPEALIAALKIYKGKPLINSVTGEERSLERVLPVIKEYGAAVVGLTQDNEGVPVNSAEKRLAIAEKIVARAEAAGIPRENIVIDCLAMSVGANPNAAVVTLDAIRMIKAKLGVNITLGASHVSYGLPDRPLLNGAFLPLAIAAGVTCPIVDAAKARPVALAADLLLNRDKFARRYIKFYRDREKGLA